MLLPHLYKHLPVGGDVVSVGLDALLHFGAFDKFCEGVTLPLLENERCRCDDEGFEGFVFWGEVGQR